MNTMHEASDSHRCKVCGELALSEAVGSYRFEAEICDKDECLQERIEQLVTAELSKSYYAETLQRISRVVVPMDGKKVDVRKLQASLIACAAAALHAINAPAYEIRSCQRFIEERRIEDHEQIEEFYHLA